jgi:replicative DNA helicase
MDKTSSDLRFDHISIHNKRAVSYIDGRRKGEIKSIKTGFSKLDKVLLDGIEWGRIFSVAAMSGSGKSVFLEQLKRQMIELNPDQKIQVLSFEFEMPSREQVLRNLSGRLKIPVSKLLSAENQLSEVDFARVKHHADLMSRYPVYSVETPGTVDQIINTMKSFIKRIGVDNKFIFTIDHVLLTSGKVGEEERRIIATLYREVVALKKWAIDLEIDVLFIFLSQLNREIERPERILNNDLHFPTRADLFGSSDIFMCSDYVLVIHKPVILGIEWYGKGQGKFSKGLPVWNPSKEGQAMIYFHLLKQRTGDPKILSMLDNFQFSEIIEYDVPKPESK